MAMLLILAFAAMRWAGPIRSNVITPTLGCKVKEKREEIFQQGVSQIMHAGSAAAQRSVVPSHMPVIPSLPPSLASTVIFRQCILTA
jgi:hypothetical protein